MRSIPGLLLFVWCISLCSDVCTGQGNSAEKDSAEKDKAYHAGPELEGIVFDSQGQPSNADVYLLKSTKSGYYTLPVSPLKTTANETGVFRFDELEPGDYRLWAENESETSSKKKLTGLSVKVGDTASEQTAPLEVRLHPGCGYDVMVQDEEGNPIAGAQVTFAWTDIRRAYHAEATGHVKIRNLPPDDWYFQIKADGFETAYLKTSAQPLGSVLPLEFVLRPGATLKGRVLNEEGQPVAGVKGSLSCREQGSVSLGRFTTDEEGRFEMSGLPRDKQIDLFAKKEGYMRLRESFANLSTEKQWTMTRRPYGGDAIVVVKDASGNPIVGQRS